MLLWSWRLTCDPFYASAISRATLTSLLRVTVRETEINTTGSTVLWIFGRRSTTMNDPIECNVCQQKYLNYKLPTNISLCCCCCYCWHPSAHSLSRRRSVGDERVPLKLLEVSLCFDYYDSILGILGKITLYIRKYNCLCFENRMKLESSFWCLLFICIIKPVLQM